VLGAGSGPPLARVSTRDRRTEAITDGARPVGWIGLRNASTSPRHLTKCLEDTSRALQFSGSPAAKRSAP
jgi:hypothetical protein